LQPQYAEETFAIAEEGIVNGGFELIVLDSIAVLALKDDSFGEKEFQDNSKVAGMAGLISRFIKRNTYAIRNSNIAFVFVNQVRDVMGSYIPMVESPGGHSLKHICSLRIFLQAVLNKDGKILINDEIIGNYIKFVIKKNKVGKPYKTYSFPLLFEVGVDYFTDLVVFAEILGVLERAGAYYRFEGENIGQGLEKTLEYLRNNRDTLDKVEKMVYNIMNKETEEYKKETVDEI
jgi:recombination protein RecA